MVGFFQLVILVFQVFFFPEMGNLFGRRISSSTAAQGHLETSREQSGTLRLLEAEVDELGVVGMGWVGCGWC